MVSARKRGPLQARERVSAVARARRAALEDEALEVRERLRDRESALPAASCGEQLERDLPGVQRVARERGLGVVDPLAVMLTQLARPRGRVVDARPVAGVRDPGRSASMRASVSR